MGMMRCYRLHCIKLDSGHKKCAIGLRTDVSCSGPAHSSAQAHCSRRQPKDQLCTGNSLLGLRLPTAWSPNGSEDIPHAHTKQGQPSSKGTGSYTPLQPQGLMKIYASCQ